MSFYFTTNAGFGTTQGTWWAAPPPPPPPPVEIVFEHNGRRHRLLVTSAVLEEWLRLSARYEAEVERRRPPRPSVDVAEQQIRILSQTTADVPLKTAVRRAKRMMHPDTGGTADGFRQVIEAEQILAEAGLL